MTPNEREASIPAFRRGSPGTPSVMKVIKQLDNTFNKTDVARGDQVARINCEVCNASIGRVLRTPLGIVLGLRGPDRRYDRWIAVADASGGVGEPAAASTIAAACGPQPEEAICLKGHARPVRPEMLAELWHHLKKLQGGEASKKEKLIGL